MKLNNKITYILLDDGLGDLELTKSKIPVGSDVLHKKLSDYQCDQLAMNEGLSESKTDFVVFLYSGDELLDNFEKGFGENLKFYDNVRLFLPIIINFDYETKKFISFKHSLFWSMSYNTNPDKLELGDLDIEITKKYLKEVEFTHFPLTVSGCVINKNTALDVGGFKSNIKYSYFLEFVLRVLSKGCKCRVMNYIGLHQYYRKQMGANFLLKGVDKGGLTYSEFEYWLNIASTEYKYSNDGSRPSFEYKQTLKM